VEIDGRVGDRASDERELMEKAASCVEQLFGVVRTEGEKQKRKPILAILGIETKSGVPTEAASIFSDRLRDEMHKVAGYEIIDRANMKNILESQGEQLKECYSQECALEVGKLVIANKIVTGTLSKLDEKFYLSISITDVETAKIERIASSECACKLTEFTGSMGAVVSDLMGRRQKREEPAAVAKQQAPAPAKPAVRPEVSAGVPKWPGWALLGAGVAAAAGGGVTYMSALDSYDKYKNSTNVTNADLKKYKDETEQNLMTSRILGGVSVLAIGGSLYFLLQGDAPADKPAKTEKKSGLDFEMNGSVARVTLTKSF
jgi:hypothetical protein